MVKIAEFIKHVRCDAIYPDMVFLLSEPAPCRVEKGKVITTKHVLVMYMCEFDSNIFTVVYPCDANGYVNSLLEYQIGILFGEHDAEKSLNELGYRVEWHDKTTSKGA